MGCTSVTLMGAATSPMRADHVHVIREQTSHVTRKDTKILALPTGAC
jgi:hypothetical protein